MDGGLNVFMSNTHDITGFQFDINGMIINSASGGSAEASSFDVATGPNGVLGVSFIGAVIPAGNGLLTSLSGTFTDLEVELTGLIITVDSEGFLHLTGDGFIASTDAISGCTDSAASNYNSSATVADGSCEFDPVVIEDVEELDSYDSSVDIDVPEIEFEEIEVDIDIPAGGLDIPEGTEVTLEVSEASEQELQDIIDNSTSADAGVEVYQGITFEALDENGDPIELVDGATLDVELTFDPERNEYDLGYITEDGEVVALGADCNNNGDGSWTCEGDGPGFGAYIVYSFDPAENISGCTDSDACNYNSDATLNDGSCLYNDCNGECGGLAAIDECGICDGSGIAEGECDCEGNILDCNNVCGGESALDECGICDGSGIAEGECDCEGNILDCNNVCGGNLINDYCNVCGGNNLSGDCSSDSFIQSVYVQSSDDSCGGQCSIGYASYHFVNENNVYINWSDFREQGETFDNGELVPDMKLFTETSFDYELREFHGLIDFSSPEGTTWNGDAIWEYNIVFSEDFSSIIGGIGYAYDSNGNINYSMDMSSDISYSRYCDNNYTEGSDVGCDGVCFSEIVLDECGECNGPGIPGGECDCDGNTLDCLGVCGGGSTVDECGECGGSGISDDECDCNGNTLDCLGVCGGSADLDNCGECNGSNNSQDCNGVCFGLAYLDECDICVGGDTNLEECSSNVDISLDLHSGANLISLYALPEDNSLSTVLSSLDDVMIGVIGEGQAASLLPNGSWVGSLSSISPTSGYWIKISDSATLLVEDAIPLDAEQEYSLHAGANLVSYPSGISQSVSSAISNDDVDYFNGIIGEGQAANILPNGSWVGSLTQFQGGKGYWFKVSEDFEFTFNAPGNLTRAINNNIKRHPDGMSYSQSIYQAFYFIEDILIDNAPIQAGSWIVAYNDNVVVGAREWNGQYTDVPAMGYDNQFITTTGYLEDGDRVRFEVIDLEGDVHVLNQDIPSWKNNEIFNVGVLTNIDIPDNISIVSAYPNPFNPLTSIDFSVDRDMSVDVSIYDINGRLMERLVKDDFSRGIYTVSWDASTYPSGLYFANIRSKHSSISKKLVLMK